MIKIIKHGNRYNRLWKAVCPSCGCEFVYSSEDIEGDMVSCPECSGVKVIHNGRYVTELNPTSGLVFVPVPTDTSIKKLARLEKKIERCIQDQVPKETPMKEVVDKLFRKYGGQR